MSFHRNAKLGLAGRYALVSRDRGRDDAEAGRSRFSVSPATAHRWWHRWWTRARRRGRRCRVCSTVRAGRIALPTARAGARRAICVCRRDTGWGPRLVADATGFCHSTVWKVLRGPDLAAAAARTGAGQPL